jgi:hypothetical protein
MLITSSALIGILTYVLSEIKQRRAFLEAKQSLEVKTMIEEQSAEQVNFVFTFFAKILFKCFSLNRFRKDYCYQFSQNMSL